MVRTEATGYGGVYFVEEMLKTKRESIEGKDCTIFGSRNVDQYIVNKSIHKEVMPENSSKMAASALRRVQICQVDRKL